MKATASLISPIFLLLIFSCDGNYKEVVIGGIVRDSRTGVPVSGSQISISCWVYDTKAWESKKVVKDTVSDDNGKFNLLFEKGEAIDVEVKHKGYERLKYSQTLDRSVNNLEFKLKEIE